MKIMGFTPVQFCILLATMCQNSGYALIRRYSQGVLKEKASSSSILLVGEFFKLTSSLAMVTYLSSNSGAPAEYTTVQKMRWLAITSAPMVVPMFVYLAMNMLSFVALQRIDAGLFTILAQAKILTTALFARGMMGKEMHNRKWRALTLVVLGAMLITNQRRPVTDKENAVSMEYVIGIAACLLEITLSGAVSIYFEKVLKATTSNHTVWDRNIQLATMSSFVFIPMAVLELKSFNIFEGFSAVTFAVAFVGAMGGILVALAVKYTDSVVKCLATSGSIVMTTIIGSVWLGSKVDFVIAVGSAMVVLAVFNYFDEGGKFVSSAELAAHSQAAAANASSESAAADQKQPLLQEEQEARGAVGRASAVSIKVQQN